MNPTFKWFTVGTPGNTSSGLCSSSPRRSKTRVIDIMGALVQSQQTFKTWVDTHYTPETVISLGGELKQYGSGVRPPSNFRFAKNPELNENVVKNYMYLITKTKDYTVNYQSPIYVNMIPREWRLLSFKITETGLFKTTINCEPSVASEFFTRHTTTSISEDMMRFLVSFGITPTKICKLRDSCKGSKYNTYLIDMIGFLYQTKNNAQGQSYFETDIRLPTIYEEPDELQKLFMNTVSDESNAYRFKVPKRETVDCIYTQLLQAINMFDNEVKQNIREYVNTHIVHRWSDFDVNDIDDALTILMIMHAYRCKDSSPTKKEKIICNKLEDQILFWFEQLN